MMADIHSMGGELFVMDDGWFGTKYPRVTDNCALGDWVVDTILRDCQEDIMPLAEFFREIANNELECKVSGFSS